MTCPLRWLLGTADRFIMLPSCLRSDYEKKSIQIVYTDAYSTESQSLREFRSKAHRSFKKFPLTWPPNTKNFDPTIVTACPYRPTGDGPCIDTQVHSRETAFPIY